MKETEKLVIVDAMFPELKGSHIYKVGRGRAAGTKAAVSRAFGDLLKQIKGKRIHMIKATITIVDSPKETP